MAWITPPEYTVIEEWLFPNRSTPPGSSSYYSVRFAKPAQRDNLALLFAWQHELRSIRNRCSDTGVALSKLRWYREELTRGANGKSQHPLIQGLGTVISDQGLALQRFYDIADAAEADILGRCYKDLEGLSDYCHLGGGALLELITQVGEGSQPAIDCARQLGAFVRLTEIIRNLGTDVRHGCLYLPLEALEKNGIPAEEIADTQYRGALQELLVDLATQARTWYAAALEHRPTEKQPALGPALSYAAIHHALLKQLQRAKFPVLEQRRSLTPLRKLWIAWRSQR